MTKKATYILIAALLVFTLMGCSKDKDTAKDKPKATPDKVVLKVNGTPITERMVQRHLGKMGAQHSKRPDALKSDEMREAVIETLVGEALVLEGARLANVVIPDDDINVKLALIKQQLGDEGYQKKLTSTGITEETFMSSLRDSMMKQRFANSLVPEGAVTEETAKRVYKESPEPHIHPAQLKVRFIQVDTFVIADKVLAKVKESGFDAAAKDLDGDDSAMVSGYGWTSPNMYSSEIAKGLRELEAGQTGGPFEGTQGYFIFHVAEKKPERPKSFEEAKGQIMSNMYSEKRRAALAHWLAKKRSVAKIEQL